MSGIARDVGQIAASSINPIAGVAFGMLFPPQQPQNVTRTQDALRDGAEPGTAIKRINGLYKISGELFDCGVDSVSGQPAGLESQLQTKKKASLFGLGGTKVTTELLFLKMADNLGIGPLYVEQVRLDDGATLGEIVVYDRYNSRDSLMPDPVSNPDGWKLFLQSQFNGTAAYRPGKGIQFTPHYAPDGTLISESSATLTLYAGTEWQGVDPALSSIHGDLACAYVGLAYAMWNHYRVYGTSPTRTFVVRSLLDDKVAIIRERFGECGVSRERMRFTSLSGSLAGMLTAQVEAPREACEKIAARDFHDLVFVDGGFRDASRINPATFVLDPLELGARFLGGAATSATDAVSPNDWTQKGARELPTMLRVQFADSDGDYNPSEAISIRQVAGHDNQVTLSYPFAARLPDMMRFADVVMDELWAGQDADKITLLGRKMQLAPGCLLVFDAFDGKGPHGARITKQPNIGANGVMEVELAHYDYGVYGVHRALNYPAPIRPSVATFVAPSFALLDLPAFDASALQAASLLFCASVPDTSPWSGAVLNAGAIGTSNEAARAALGTLLSGWAFSASDCATFSATQTIRVQLVSGTLATASPQSVANGANLLGIATPVGTALLSFCVATPIAGMANTYDLSGLWPGRMGNENVPIPSGATAVLLCDALGKFSQAGESVAVSLSQIGIPCPYDVEAARDANAATPGTITPSGRSLRPLMVCGVRKSSDGTSLSFFPRTRDFQGVANAWQTGRQAPEADPRTFKLELRSGGAVVSSRTVSFDASAPLPLSIALSALEHTADSGSLWHEGAYLQGDETRFAP